MRGAQVMVAVMFFAFLFTPTIAKFIASDNAARMQGVRQASIEREYDLRAERPPPDKDCY